jgi:hypothetical protein
MTYRVFPVADDYQRHPIHTQERNWAETNCYVDVWIELLHAWGFDPVAALPFTVGIDFEGDQWTFFKFPLTDLRELYGLDVQELLIWRPLAEHVVEQVRRGRPVLVELDSYYLPDTEGTAYQREHVKSTVAVVEIDLEHRRMGYFHGQGFYHVAGDDFTNLLRIGEGWPAELLPPYVEFVKPREAPRASAKALVAASLRLLRREVDRLPGQNPFVQFRRAFAQDLSWLTSSPLDVFHHYSFATWRQFGACYELTATYLQWLKDRRVSGFEEAQRAFADLSGGAKTLQFQLARAMARKKPLDLSLLDVLAATWNRAVDELRSGLAWNESSVEHDPEFVEMR